MGAIVAGTDGAHAALVPASDILEERIELAFDHLRIIRDAVERIRVELEVSAIATAVVGTTFTMAELRAVYEARPGRGGGRPAGLSSVPLDAMDGCAVLP